MAGRDTNDSPKPAGQAKTAAKSAVSIRLFGKAKLGMGIGERVIITRSGLAAKRIACEFAGASENEFLIIKAPMVPGIKDMLREGDALTLRYLHKGALYGFRAHVLSTVFKPAPLIVIEYPYSVEKIELRDSKRVDCMLPCRLRMQPGETLSAMMVDVSLSGCRVACANEDSKACEDLLNTGRDTPVTLSLRLTSESELLEITGRLKSVDTKQDNTFTGVAFENLDDATRQALTRFIQEAEMYSAS